jgi:hypothetical protein
MTDFAPTTDPLLRAYEHAYAVHERARTRLIDVLLARIAAFTAESYPAAVELVIEGLYDVEGIRLRAQKVLDAEAKAIDGFNAAGESSSDGWDEFCEDMDSILLDELAGLTGDEYSGEHSIAVPGVALEVPEVTAEAMGVAVNITTSAGSDGAVLVILDTTFEPDGSDGGPGLRVMVNDGDGFVGVPWAPSEDDAYVPDVADFLVGDPDPDPFI